MSAHASRGIISDEEFNKKMKLLNAEIKKRKIDEKVDNFSSFVAPFLAAITFGIAYYFLKYVVW